MSSVSTSWSDHWSLLFALSTLSWKEGSLATLVTLVPYAFHDYSSSPSPGGSPTNGARSVRELPRGSRVTGGGCYWDSARDTIGESNVFSFTSPSVDFTENGSRKSIFRRRVYQGWKKIMNVSKHKNINLEIRTLNRNPHPTPFLYWNKKRFIYLQSILD